MFAAMKFSPPTISRTLCTDRSGWWRNGLEGDDDDDDDDNDDDVDACGGRGL